MQILKRITCKKSCSLKNDCKNMPLEINGNDTVDILFVTEFPGKSESLEEKYLVKNEAGVLFRNVISSLADKYKFSYAVTGLTKASNSFETATQNFQAIKHCALQRLPKEIEHVNPKVIVLLGDLCYKVFYDKPLDFGSKVEDGRMDKIDVFGTKREVMFCVHPSAYTKRADPCSIGILYENIRRAIFFIKKGRDWRVPKNFETNLITKVKDVKGVLAELATIKDFCAVDTEGPNLNRIYDTHNHSLQLCADGKVGHVIPLDHYDSPLKNKVNDIYPLIKDFFTKKTNIKGYIYVNAKFDYHKIYRDIKSFSFNAPQMDISFAEFSLEENLTRVFGFPKGKGAFSLFTMAYKRSFDYYAQTDGKEKRDRLAYLPLSEWATYGGADVVCPWHIYRSQLMIAEDTKYLKDFVMLNEVFFNHLCRITTYCEHCGLSINFNVVEALVQKSGALNLAINEVQDKFYQSENVKQANEELVKEELGIDATGLFGTTNIWHPNKIKHRDKLYFDVLGLEPIEDDEEENATTGKAFQNIYSDVPEVKLLSEYNALAKLQTSFVNPLYKWMRKTSPDARPDLITDFRARGSFLNDAVTGRLKSISPNTQQRPTHGKYAKQILGMYEPPKGRVVIKLDYSTFEVRGLGFLSEDVNMIKSFSNMKSIKDQFRKNPLIFLEDGYDTALKSLKELKNQVQNKKDDFESYKEELSKTKRKELASELKQEIKAYKEKRDALKNKYENDPVSLSKAHLKTMTDFHRSSASLFNKVPIDKVTEEQRQSAKNIVFGSIYGRTVESIAKVLGISKDLANTYFQLFMDAMPYAVKWLEEKKKQGRKLLYVSSPMGRRRRLWGHLHKKGGIVSKMDRYAMNTIIQGFCSDCNLVASSLLISFIEKHNKLKYQTSDKKAWFCTNLVHDSLEMEIPVEDVIYFVENIEKLFTSYLQYYIKHVFGFEIKVPIEVDFSIGINYANYQDWNGSKQHLLEIAKNLLKEVNEKDGTNIKLSALTKNEFFNTYKKGEVAKQVVKDFVKKDRK